MTPVGQRILVENVRAEDNVNGLYIPEAAREKRTAEAVVVAVGPRVEIDVGGRNLGVGDRVFTDRFAGQPVKCGSRELRMLAPAELLAFITNPAK